MRKLFALMIAFALSGCGLHPVYEGGSSSPAASGFQSIEVGPIPQRVGWLTRNALVDRFGGEHPGAVYRLEVELDDNITGFGIRGDSATTRERRTLRARYRLVERATGAVVLDATAGSDAGIDVVSSEYATIAAEQTAAERLSEVISDQIVARVARYMSGTSTPAVKAGKSDLERALDRPDPVIRFYLFHGADDAGSRVLADRLLRGLKAERVAIGPSSARNDPASIVDEAGAMGLFGDRRALWIEPAGEDIVPAIEILMQAPAIESPVIAITGSLRKTSALLKLAENEKLALSFVSYPLEGRDAERMVLEIARSEGLRLRDDVAARVASESANNPAIVASEILKFALYLGAAPTAIRDLEHDTIDKLGADSGESDWARIGDLALDGQLNMLGEKLQRLPSGSAEIVPIVRSLQRRILQIAALRGRVEAGERLDGVLTSLGKSLFWRDKPLLQRLVSQWTASRLEHLGSRIAGLERRLMFSPVSGESALGEELLAIARAARR